MKLAVIIASTGRPAEVEQLLENLGGQTRLADLIVVSAAEESDVPVGLASDVVQIFGSRGLPAQRNRGLVAVSEEYDLVAFLDDDYVACKTALGGMIACFETFPDVVGANGVLLADGINTVGIPYEKAKEIVATRAVSFAPPPRILSALPNGLYGCNMVFRRSAVEGVRFDERLPLYGWQEDVDFSYQVGARGRLIKTDAFCGVHRGVKNGRVPGCRLGYSQVINPLYLCRKGTIRWGFGMKLMLNNLFANHLRALFPEPWVDRKGRLYGNWLAIRDVFAGNINPERILELH